jgi:3-hydroxyacyl-[acyl-carrier-protein] dehydratase
MTPNSELLKSALGALPHGESFRFVDQLVSLIPGKEGVGEYLVRSDEPFLQAHFPGNPMLPGVLLVEAAAQLAGIVAQNDPLIPPVANLRLSALRMVRIHGTARPGQVLRIEAQVVGRLGLMIQANARAFVEGMLILEAQLTLGGRAD